MCKLCWTLLVSAVIVAIVAVLLIATGNKTSLAPDGREVILLKPEQRNLVLLEMRTFVDSIREITLALGTDQRDQASVAARKVGLAAQQGVPLDMMKALPLPFKKMGMDTHKKFDLWADNIENGASREDSLIELSQIMGNCVACHAAYQLQSSSPPVRN